LAEANPNAQIGDVQIAGDWIASNLVAGAAWNDNFGNNLDKKIGAGLPPDPEIVDNPNIAARIANIVVKGQILGTDDIAGDRFGFIAQEIVSMKIGAAGHLVLLDAGVGNDNDAATLRYNLTGTGDVRVFEFA
jgi:hypothetical protein